MPREKSRLDFGENLAITAEKLSNKKSGLFDKKIGKIWKACKENATKYVTEPAFFVKMTSGRYFIRDFVNGGNKDNGKNRTVSEIDILKFAFIAELLQINLTVEQAATLFEHGITLRDIQSKSAQELAAQRWSFVNVDEKNKLDTILSKLTDLGAAGGYRKLPQKYFDTDVDDLEAKTITLNIEKTQKDGWEEDFKRWKAKADELVSKGIDLNKVEFYDLLVVSDFHLAAGNHPTPEGIARFSPTEDFFYDDAFFRFVYSMNKERMDRGGYPYELIFNGDMVDFAQIVVPENLDKDKNPLIPWPLPPLRSSYIEGSVIASRKKRQEEILPARLFKILKDVYGAEVFKKAVDNQIKLLKKYEDLQTAGELDDISKMVSRGLDVTAPVNGTQYLSPNKLTLTEEQEEELHSRTDTLIEETHYKDRDYSRARVLAMQRDKALGQLADLYHGHRVFFQALAWFIVQGNRLVFMRGNHDPQWYWPEVQLAFVGWLHKAYLELKEICKDGKYEFPVATEELELPSNITLDYFERQVDFNQAWFYYRDRLVYIEHGGQQEAVDCHRYFLLPVYAGKDNEVGDDEGGDYELESFPHATTWLPELKVSPQEKEIEPPLGSLGLVYFVNTVETLLPNFDRPEYKKIVLDYLRYESLKIISKLLKALWRTIKTWIRWALLPFAGVITHFLKQISGLKKPFKTWHSEIHAKKIKAYARLTGMPEDCVKELDHTRWVNRWRTLVASWFFIILNVAVSLLLVGVLLLIVYIGLDELLIHGGFLDRIMASNFVTVIRNFVDEKLPIVNLIYGSSGEELGVLKNLIKWVLNFLYLFLLFWAIRGLRNWIGLGEDFLRRPAQNVAFKLAKHKIDVLYITFGHDHVSNAQRLESYEGRKKDARPWYLNTGSWLCKYEKDRKRLYRADHEYSFLRMIDTHRILAAGTEPDTYLASDRKTKPIVQLLRWNDANSKVESCVTFQGLVESS